MDTDAKRIVGIPYGRLCALVGLLDGVVGAMLTAASEKGIRVDGRAEAVLRAASALTGGVRKDCGLNGDDVISAAAAACVACRPAGEGGRGR